MTIQKLTNAHFPVRAFSVATLLVCLGLGTSAAISFWTLKDLRTEYLENRGRDIASALDRSARGPGRRNSAEFWRDLLEGHVAEGPEAGFFLVVTDGEDRPLAWAGIDESALGNLAALEPGTFHDDSYLFSQELTPRGMGRPAPGQGRGRTPIGRLIVGVPTSGADFLMRQANLQLTVTAVAIALLVILSFYLSRTVDRLLALRSKEETERHLADLGRMSATLAHEIRNPLGAIKGLTQVVQEELPRGHRANELMQTVVGEAERLEKLVNDLLLFARPKKVQLQAVDLNALVDETVDLLKPVAMQEAVDLAALPSSTRMVVQSDSDSLRQVLLNTIVNAIEASSAGGEITVEIGETPGNPRVAQIAVRDRGEGLRSQAPESLFEPFRTTKATGSGLGLPVSRRIMNDLGGTITLADREGGGAVCEISLPVNLGVIKPEPSIMEPGIETGQ